MKHSFKIVYHKSIPFEEIKGFLEGKKEHFLSPGSYKTGGWGHLSFYRRGIFGLSLQGCRYSSQTFKRLVANKRIFGVIPVTMLERKDGKKLETDGCMCAIHRGGQRVNIIGGFKPEDYKTFYDCL